MRLAAKQISGPSDKRDTDEELALETVADHALPPSTIRTFTRTGETFPHGRKFHEENGETLKVEWQQLDDLLADRATSAHRDIRIDTREQLQALVHALHDKPELHARLKTLRIVTSAAMTPIVRTTLTRALKLAKNRLTELLNNEPYSEIRRAPAVGAPRKLPSGHARQTWQIHDVMEKTTRTGSRLRTQLQEKTRYLAEHPTERIILTLAENGEHPSMWHSNLQLLTHMLVRFSGRVSVDPKSARTIGELSDGYLEHLQKTDPAAFVPMGKAPVPRACDSLEILGRQLRAGTPSQDPRFGPTITIQRHPRQADRQRAVLHLTPEQLTKRTVEHVLRLLIQYPDDVILDRESRACLLPLLQNPAPAIAAPPATIPIAPAAEEREPPASGPDTLLGRIGSWFRQKPKAA